MLVSQAFRLQTYWKWVDGKQTGQREERRDNIELHTRQGPRRDAMAVPVAREEHSVSMNQNQSSVHSLEGSPRAKYYCRLFVHAARCDSQQGSATQALPWLEKRETQGWRD